MNLKYCTAEYEIIVNTHHIHKIWFKVHFWISLVNVNSEHWVSRSLIASVAIILYVVRTLFFSLSLYCYDYVFFNFYFDDRKIYIRFFNEHSFSSICLKWPGQMKKKCILIFSWLFYISTLKFILLCKEHLNMYVDNLWLDFIKTFCIWTSITKWK